MSPEIETFHVHTKCPECGKTDTIAVSAAGYNAWQGGELIQRALPELSADAREQFITGYCSACWDKLFKETD